MKRFQYGCALSAIGYFLAAAMPVFLTITHRGANASLRGALVPLTASLLLVMISFGVHSRKRIFWRVIPVLAAAFLLDVTVPPSLYMAHRSEPYMPLVVAMIAIFGLFLAWWRYQREYFSSR